MADTIGEAFVAVRPDLSDFESEIQQAIATISVAVPVAGDTTELTSDIAAVTEGAVAPVEVAADTADAEAAIDTLLGAPATLDIEADTTAALADADGLVAQVDALTAEVDVTADTAAAEAEVEGLIEEAGSLTAEVAVSAEGASEAQAGIEGLTGATEGLGAVAGVTVGSASGLVESLAATGPAGAAAAAGVGAAVVGIGALFKAGLDAEATQQRYNLVLGEFAEEVRRVDVGSLNTGLEDLAIQLGTDDEALLNTAANIFALGQTSGRSAPQVAETTDQIIALAARSVALNPSLGSVATVADGLTNALARGGRASARFQIDLNGQEVAARAAAIALEDGRTVVTQFDKTTAGAQIAVERFGSTLGETVAQGAENSQIRLRSVVESFQNVIETAGRPLVAPILELLEQSIEPASAIAEVFKDIGLIAIPLVSVALQVLAPALEAVGAFATLVAPPLEFFAGLIESIPDPILAGATAIAIFAGAAVVAGPVILFFANQVLAAISAITAASAAMLAVNPILLGVAVAVGAAAAAWSFFNQESESNQQAVNELTQALADQNDVLDLSVGNVEAYLVKSSEIGKNADQQEALNALGVSFKDLGDLSDHGRRGLDLLTSSAVALGKATDVTNEEQSTLENVIQVNGRAFQVMDKATRAVIVNYKNLANDTNDTAKAQLIAAVNTRDLSQAQLDLAVSSHSQRDENGKLIESSTDYVAVQQELKPVLDDAGRKQAEVNQQTKDAAAAQVEAAAAAQKHVDAMNSLRTEAPGVALALDGIVNSIGSQAPALEALAVNMGQVQLTDEQLKAVAETLGVNADKLKGFVDVVNTAINDLVSSATQKLPTAQTALDTMLKFFTEKLPEALNPKTLIDLITENLKATANFLDNIRFLFDQGLPFLTEFALKQGPEVTAALVQGIKDGGPDVGKALDATIHFSDEAGRNAEREIRGIAQQLVIQTGFVGEQMTASFGETFRIEAPTVEEMERARLVAELSNIPLSEALRQVAGSGAVAYQEAMGVLPTRTEGIINGVTTTIDGKTGQVTQAGEGLGNSVNTGFTDPTKGIGQVDPAAKALGDVIFNATQGKAIIDQVESAGNLLGVALTSGVVVGIQFGTGTVPPRSGVGVTGAMMDMIDQAIEAAKRQAGVRSPSTVFAEIGRNMGAGLVLGLNSSQTAVGVAAGRLTGAAAIRGVDFSLPATGAPGGPSVAAGTTIDNRRTFVIHTTDPFVAASEVIRKDRAASRELELLA